MVRVMVSRVIIVLIPFVIEVVLVFFLRVLRGLLEVTSLAVALLAGGRGRNC